MTPAGSAGVCCKPRLRIADRALWVLLSRLWNAWRGSLKIVQPDTVVRWHREGFTRRVDAMGIEQIAIAAHSPWQNEMHLRRLLREYLAYYHGSRTHLGIGKDCPETRAVEPPVLGRIVELPLVGGLHHRYLRRAA